MCAVLLEGMCAVLPPQVHHVAECIAACRRGAMACERSRADPPLGSDEVGLSFLFHESGIGTDTADLVRGKHAP